MMNQNKADRCLVWRAKARFIFKFLLAVGFSYQSIRFVQMYTAYPSVVELDADQPSNIELPAFSICNINEVRSSAYCERYPTRCGHADSIPGFCLKYKDYCKLVNTTVEVPVVDVSSFRNLSRYAQQLLGHTFEDFVRKCTIEIDGDEENCSTPILLPALGFSHEVPFNCFMFNSLTGNPDSIPRVVPISTKIHIDLDLQLYEYHPSHLSRGAQFTLHTPYHVPSPVNEGLFMNMGNIYRLYVRVVDKELLPHPFKSNCTDYISAWKANGGRGPVTQRMCKEKCKLVKSLSLFDCADYHIDYPHNETYCGGALYGFQKVSRDYCTDQCTSACRIREYVIDKEEAHSEGSRKTCLYSHEVFCRILIHISFDNMEVTTFTYKQRFEPIGILSFLGGYVGLWLGISLLTVYDFIETRFFRLLVYLKRKSASRKKRRKISRVQSSPNNS